MTKHSKLYTDTIKSSRWKQLRTFILELRGAFCERCGQGHLNLELHHKTYDNLGKETRNDVQLLCPDCHEKADKEREKQTQQRARARFYQARLDGWATKKYGEHWNEYSDADRIEEEFDAWLEGRDD